MHRSTRIILTAATVGTMTLTAATAFANMQFGVRVVDCDSKTPLEGVLVHGFIGSQLEGDDELYDYTNEEGYAYLAGANADNVLYCNYNDNNHACAVRFEMEGYQVSYHEGVWINTAEAVNINGTNYDNYYRHYTEEGGHPLDEMTVEICPVNTVLDADGDGIEDQFDNCPLLPNAGNQNDADGDGFGDMCDNCINVPNPDQLDGDFDGLGNACTEMTTTIPDTDGDGIPNNEDNCVSFPNPDQIDGDGDGFGDLCDNDPTIPNDDQEVAAANPENGDYDRDGVPDVSDNCPTVPNADQNRAACNNPGNGGGGGGGDQTPTGDDNADDDTSDDDTAAGGTIDDGGCSVASTGNNAGLGGLIMLALGLAFVLRRRA